MSEYLRAKTDRSINSLTARAVSWGVADQCHSRARQSLWSLMVFMLISICAYSCREFNLFEAASEPVRQLLGYPPPAFMVSIALAIYCFSNIILTLTAMANETPPASPWKHLGYRGAFFLFYSFSGAIADQFIPVLLAGLCLYGLDQIHIWQYNSKALQQEKGLLN